MNWRILFYGLSVFFVISCGPINPKKNADFYHNELIINFSVYKIDKHGRRLPLNGKKVTVSFPDQKDIGQKKLSPTKGRHLDFTHNRYKLILDDAWTIKNIGRITFQVEGFKSKTMKISEVSESNPQPLVINGYGAGAQKCKETPPDCKGLQQGTLFDKKMQQALWAYVMNRVTRAIDSISKIRSVAYAAGASYTCTHYFKQQYKINVGLNALKEYPKPTESADGREKVTSWYRKIEK